MVGRVDERRNSWVNFAQGYRAYFKGRRFSSNQNPEWQRGFNFARHKVYEALKSPRMMMKPRGRHGKVQAADRRKEGIP